MWWNKAKAANLKLNLLWRSNVEVILIKHKTWTFWNKFFSSTILFSTVRFAFRHSKTKYSKADLYFFVYLWQPLISFQLVQKLTIWVSWLLNSSFCVQLMYQSNGLLFLTNYQHDNCVRHWRKKGNKLGCPARKLVLKLFNYRLKLSSRILLESRKLRNQISIKINRLVCN